MEQVIRDDNLRQLYITGIGEKAPYANVKFSDDQKAVVQSLEKVKQDPTLQERYSSALTEELSKPSTRKLMEEELSHLTQTVFGIKQHFESVRSTLYKFDQKKYRKLKPDGTAGGDYIEPLEPKWNDFRAVG